MIVATDGLKPGERFITGQLHEDKTGWCGAAGGRPSIVVYQQACEIWQIIETRFDETAGSFGVAVR
jgi:hypothetical protein